MVIASNGKAWEGIHHVCAEALFVLTLKLLHHASLFIIIKGGRHIDIVLAEVGLVLIVFVVHLPFGVAKHGDFHVLVLAGELVELVHSHGEFRRATSVQYHDIALGERESLCKIRS